jgi:hypothetical protein
MSGWNRRPKSHPRLPELVMKRFLATILPALVGLAGCGAGSDTCTSSPAQVATASGASCSLAPGASATINVTLCAKCSDSNPSCQAEIRNGTLELAPAVQQCQANAGCAVSGCNLNTGHAACQVTLPNTPGTLLPVQIVGDNQVPATIDLSGSSTSCTL